MTPGSCAERAPSRATRRSDTRWSAPPPGRRTATPASPRSGASSDRNVQVSSGESSTARRMPLLEAAAHGARQRRGRAEAREERVLQVREQAPAAPDGRLRRLPDLLGRERDLVLLGGLERVRERERAAHALGRDDADPEAQRALGQRVEDRQAPLREAPEHGGVRGGGGRLGEARDRERLGPGAGAPALGRQDLAEHVARRGVHGRVQEALQDGRRGREAASGETRRPPSESARETGGRAAANRRKRSFSWGSVRTGRQRARPPSAVGATRRRRRRSYVQRATSDQYSRSSPAVRESGRRRRTPGRPSSASSASTGARTRPDRRNVRSAGAPGAA